MSTGRRYEVAISFAGEDRNCAEALAEALRRRNVTIFYDKYEKADLWGKNLYTHLSDVYQNQAEYCVMLLSRHYAKKAWTNHEREAAQARAFQEHEEYILPVRLDDAEIPGIPPTVAYLKWPPDDAESIADAILAKLAQAPRDHRPNRQTDKRPMLETPIVIKLGDKLLNTSLRFGLLHVRDGKDQVPDHGPLLNKEIYFEEINDRGTSLVKVRHDKVLGFQFKCFVDHRGYSFEWVKEALEASGFDEVAKGEGKQYRAWFLLRDYGICQMEKRGRESFVDTAGNGQMKRPIEGKGSNPLLALYG